MRIFPKAQCSTVLVRCLDFRLNRAIGEALARDCPAGDFDTISVPGGAAALAIPDLAGVVMRGLEIALEVHRASTVILSAHQDCLALGGAAQFSEETAENNYLDSLLANGRAAVRKHWPGVNCDLWRICYNGTTYTVEKLGL
jgi:carbonic anhydrase